MAAAIAHMPGSEGSLPPQNVTVDYSPPTESESDRIVREAMEQMERGQEMTVRFEQRSLVPHAEF